MQESIPSLPPGTPWWGYVLAVVLGGGGVRVIQLFLESRKLERSDFRQLLEAQIAAQARQLESMQAKLDQSQDERLSILERENVALRARIGELERHIGELETRLAAKG